MTSIEAPQTPFTEILAWAAAQPLWQQEALRIILETNARLSKPAATQLAALCIAEVGGAKVDVKPLGADDLPLATAAVEPITLLGFGHAQNINALASNQWIKTGPQLTIVFGNNASGKTGYARILKKAFRARVVDDLQPDVRADTLQTGPPAATFEFQKGAAPSTKVSWSSAVPLSPDVASRFAVFDARCGQAYVVNNELQLAPRGLDVLPRLVEALDLVRAELAGLRAGLSVAKTFLEGVPLQTAAAGTVQRITAATEPADVLPSLQFTEANAQRLEGAKDELAQLRTPRQVITQTEAAIRAAKALQAALRTRAALTSKEAVAQLGQLREALAAATAATKKVESLSADQKLASGVGSDLWMTLIRAAADFVEENGEGSLPDQKRCPLCLEKLPDPARTRLARFWKALNSAAADQKAAAQTALDERLEQLSRIATDKEEELEALVAVVAPHAPLLGMSVAAALASTGTTARKLATKKPTEGVDIAGALAEVDAALAAAGSKLASLQKGAAGAATEVARLNAEIQELEAKKLLCARTPQIQEHVVALRLAAQLDAALASIKSLAATQKSGALNERYVTDSYRTGVEAELERLGFTRPVPVLTQQGSKGKVKILALANPKLKTVAPDQVFSEGERTAIAIASFFSELALTPSPMGLIFDDPISSLDQRTREKVAQRLVDESSKRQVIVFTHDLLFQTELNRFAKDKAVRVQSCELQSTSTVVGLVVAG